MDRTKAEDDASMEMLAVESLLSLFNPVEQETGRLSPVRHSDNGTKGRPGKRGSSAAAPKRGRPAKAESSDSDIPSSRTQSANKRVAPAGGHGPNSTLPRSAGNRQQDPTSGMKRVRVQGIQHDISQALLEKAVTEPQLLSFRRTGKSLNLCLLYGGTAYAGYFALNARANEDLNASSTSRSSDVSQAAVQDDANTTAGNEDTGVDGGRGRRRRAAHNYAHMADGSAAAALAASQPIFGVEGKEIISKQKEIDSKEEWDRMAAQGPAVGAVCALCHNPEDISRTLQAPSTGTTGPDTLGKLLLTRPSAKRMPCWIHEECAIWSTDLNCPDAEERSRAESLSAALRKGLATACVLCHRKGATAQCFNSMCKKMYHVSCAKDQNCFMDASARWCLACPQHHSHARHTLEAQRLASEKGMDASKHVAQLPAVYKNLYKPAMPGPQVMVPHPLAAFDARITSESGLNPQMFRSKPGPNGPDLTRTSGTGELAVPPGMMYNNQISGMQLNTLDPRLAQQLYQNQLLPYGVFGNLAPHGMAHAIHHPAVSCVDSMGEEDNIGMNSAQQSQGPAQSTESADVDGGLLSGTRCPVCRIQRKGRCGTLSAPKTCKKREHLENTGISVPAGPPKISRTHRTAHDTDD